jgi:hypothetical protein
MSRPAEFVRSDAEDVPRAEPEPADPPVGEGEDDPLILWFLSLSLAQRLEVAQGFVDSVRMLKNGLRS